MRLAVLDESRWRWGFVSMLACVGLIEACAAFQAAPTDTRDGGADARADGSVDAEAPDASPCAVLFSQPLSAIPSDFRIETADGGAVVTGRRQADEPPSLEAAANLVSGGQPIQSKMVGDVLLDGGGIRAELVLEYDLYLEPAKQAYAQLGCALDLTTADAGAEETIFHLAVPETGAIDSLTDLPDRPSITREIAPSYSAGWRHVTVTLVPESSNTVHVAYELAIGPSRASVEVSAVLLPSAIDRARLMCGIDYASPRGANANVDVWIRNLVLTRCDRR